MERLTKREGNFVTVGKKPRGFLCSTEYCKSAFECPNVLDRTCPYLKMLDRLAAYEDTGLEPKEIQKLKAEAEKPKRTVSDLIRKLKRSAYIVVHRCVTKTITATRIVTRE